MKRMIFVRFGFFQEEGPEKGHLDEQGKAQMASIADLIKKHPIEKQKTIIFSPSYTLNMESAEIIKDALGLKTAVVPSEKWKAGISEDRERKQILAELFADSDKYDLVIVVTSSQNLNGLPKVFLESKTFEGFAVSLKPVAADKFGTDFVQTKFGFEVRWQTEPSPVINIEEISVDI